MHKAYLSKILSVILCVMLLLVLFIPTASADMGPKASVHITFENMSDTLCYGTLLSKNKSTGPASVWNGLEEDARHNGNFGEEYLDYEIWKAFAEYKDSDGYYFLQEAWVVSEKHELVWGYYPPDDFKILLYYPETNTFTVSGLCERYAFDTYYTVDMSQNIINSVEYDNELSTNERINAYRSYNYTQELFSLAVRIVLTIIIETAIGLLFGFRKKKQILLLFAVNTFTQIVLNILLNVINYSEGEMAFTVFYILLEVAIFIAEAVFYCRILKKYSEKHKSNIYFISYSFIANAVSFGTGLLLAHWIPGIF